MATNKLAPRFRLCFVINCLLLFVHCKESSFGESELRSGTDADWKQLLRGDEVDAAAAANSLLRRRSSCTRRCQSSAFRDSCLAHCLSNTATTAARRLAPVSAGTRRRSVAVVRTGCPTDQVGSPCAGARRPVTDTDPHHAVVDDWTAASPQFSDFDTRPTSKRGYNSLDDLCMAYNCPHAAPLSLEYIRCAKQNRC